MLKFLQVLEGPYPWDSENKEQSNDIFQQLELANCVKRPTIDVTYFRKASKHEVAQIQKFSRSSPLCLRRAQDCYHGYLTRFFRLMKTIHGSDSFPCADVNSVPTAREKGRGKLSHVPDRIYQTTAETANVERQFSCSSCFL